jgi:hypothetical protein
MPEQIDELRSIHAALVALADRCEGALSGPLDSLIETAKAVGKAWSGSVIGYHAYVYYADLVSPPPGHHFSSEWGLHRSSGDWREYDPEDIRKLILEESEVDLDAAEELCDEARSSFEEQRDELISVLESIGPSRDNYLDRVLDDVQKLKCPPAGSYFQRLLPNQLVSRDSLAISQGSRRPPHLALLCRASEIRATLTRCRDLAREALKAASHLERTQHRKQAEDRIGTNVFIGHGRSSLWRELKDFVQDRLNLPWDEFNRIPVAGVANIARLSEMLDAAAVALIVMTAEDERADGVMQARMNVIHEAGLFQGRLGFTKAIVLAEEGCEEFSNIHGLGQIRFPPGNIAAAFEEVREVLEREGLL